MSLIKNIQRNARRIERLSRKVDLTQGFADLQKDWQLEQYEAKLRQDFEAGRITESEFDRLLNEKEVEVMSARCSKCGDIIKGEEDSLCQYCV